MILSSNDIPDEKKDDDTDSDSEDDASARELMLKKMSMSIDNSATRELVTNNDGSESDSDSDDDTTAQELMAKKLSMSTQATINHEPNDDIKSDNKPIDPTPALGSSSSESDSGEDSQILLQKKLQLLKQSKASTNDTDNQEKKSDNDNKLECANQETETGSGYFSQAELFGSDSESGSEVSENELSPKKKVRKLSSSEEEEEQLVKKKMVSLGRENADTKKIKKKIQVEKKFGLLAKMKEEQLVKKK